MIHVFILLGLAGCPKQVPSTPPGPVASTTGAAVLVQAQVMNPENPLPPARLSRQEERMAAVLKAAWPAANACYQASLGRDPYVYGEVLVRFQVAADGSVPMATSVLDTVGDDSLVECVEGVVRSQTFEAPASVPFEAHYPFVFTSDLTPSEVVRALRIQYKLPSTPSTDREPGDPDRPPEPGTVENW